MNWYQVDIETIFRELETRVQGYSTAEAAARLQVAGPNELKEGKKKGLFSMLLAQFKDVMILILLAAAIISGVIGDFTDTIVILIIVVLNAVIGFFQEYKAEKAIQALKQMSVAQVRVMRDNHVAQVPSTEIVPGDIVLLEAGNGVPADVRIIESNNLKIGEAALTGESQAIDKIAEAIPGAELAIGDRKNMAFKGTFVTYGRGKAVVTGTGMHTELGRIAAMLQEKESLTPLQLRMDAFGKKLSILVLILCVVFFVSGWWRGEDTVKMALTSISLAVAAIPEALPAVITISLALAAKRMIRFNSLIRKLPAVETLGSVTYICTDKTGTLTKNKMYVEDVYVNDRLYPRSELPSIIKEENANLLLHAIALNNDAIEDNEQNFKGDSTEIALAELAKELKTGGGWERKEEIAFDSERMLMTTFHQANGKFISFTKGAPDVLLKRCKNAGNEHVGEQVNDMAAKGQRVLGFAYRYWNGIPGKPTTEEHEQDLEFLGLAGIIDPPREEVIEAVSQCKTAGIIPVMITGDHPLTAKNIAERIGILSGENDKIITGQEFAGLNDASFPEQVEHIKVYARVSPEQKMKIVKTLQEKGHFVAMTGDGVNDAPSLKKANIGIAMGITGTDVSKEASDMILLDDNFSTIVKAIREGRRIYDNILKFIKFLMTTNSSELLTLLIGPLVGLPVALLPIHILWINLVSDGLPAISLSFEKAEQDIMKRPPRSPKQTVFANGRGVHMIWVGILMAGIALGLQYWAMQNGWAWQTMLFNFLCLGQMAHVLAIRSEKESFFSKRILSNKLLIVAVLLTIVLQATITFVPSLQPVFKTEALSMKEFMIVGVCSSLVLFAVEIEKAISRKRMKPARP